MTEKNAPIKKIAEDGLLYITLLNREMNQLNDIKIIKTYISLKLIESYKNPSISNLGMKINVSKSQMTSKIDGLVEKGYIERINDDIDRRIIRIRLTKKGHKFIQNTQKILETDINKLLTPLSNQEIKELEKSIQNIKKAVIQIQNAKKNSET